MSKLAGVEIKNEEIVIHPTATLVGQVWVAEARIIGKVVLNGKEYGFNKVVDVDLEEVEGDGEAKQL